MSSLLIIRSLFKKSRLQIILISIMLIVASTLASLSLILAMDYKDNFFRQAERLGNENEIMLFADLTGKNSEGIEEALSKHEQVAGYSVTDLYLTQGITEYGEGTYSSLFSLMRLSDATARSVGRFDILEEEGEGVIIPYLFKSNHSYQIGDTITLSLNQKDYDFRVKGFYANLGTGATNCRDMVFLLSDEAFSSLNQEGFAKGYRISVSLKNPEKAETVETDLLNTVASVSPFMILYDATNYIKLYNTRYVGESLFSGILYGASIVVIVVLISIIAVTLGNYIRENMRNLGVFKALGYTSRRIILPIALSFLGLSFLAATLGYGLAYWIFPVINNTIETMSGIPYAIRFLWEPGLITIGALSVLVFLTALFSLLKIARIEPIMAIRPGSGKKVTKSVLPLNKTTIGLNLALGIKSIFSDFKKYAVFFVSACLITFMLAVSAFTIEYIYNNTDSVLKLVFGNTADVACTVSKQNEEALTSFLADNTEVDSFYLESWPSVCHVDGIRLFAEVRDEKAFLNAQYLLIEGRFPQTENEVALNYLYANKCNLHIGDSILLSLGDVEQSYTICGIEQGAMTSGKSLAMTLAGYERIAPLTNLTYYVFLKEDIEIDAFRQTLGDAVPLLKNVNYRSYAEALSASYIQILRILVLVFVAVSLLITLFVLSIIVNMLLFNKRRMHGILKSLGFVTRQIVFQTAVSFVPVALIGSVLGAVICKYTVSSLFTLFVQNIGIYSLGGVLSTVYCIACCVLFVGFSFLITFILAGRVKNIAPHDLFNNE